MERSSGESRHHFGDSCRALWQGGKLHLEIDPECGLFALLAELATDGDALAEPRHIHQEILYNGDFRFDPVNRVATYLGHEVYLSRTEARVIETLWRADGEIVPYSKLLSSAWGYVNGLKGSDLVRSHLRNIRRKFSAAGIPVSVLQSVRGYGARISVSKGAA